MKTNACEAASIYAKAAKLAWPNAPKKARDIIAQWYENEGAAEDFDTAKELAEFMEEDIEAMLDAATDPDEIKAVCAATGCEAPSGGEAPKYVREPDERDAADAIIEYLGKSFKRIDPVGSNKLKLAIAGDAAKKMAKMKEIATQFGCTVKLRSDGTVVVSKPKSEGFRLELVDTIAVPQWLYDAYIMGDEYSGHLTMTEQEKLADFKARFDKYRLDNHDEEAQYCGTNEFDGMGGLCYDVGVYRRSSDEAKKNESKGEGVASYGTDNPEGFAELARRLEADGFSTQFSTEYTDDLAVVKDDKAWIVEYNDDGPSDNPEEPWDLFASVEDGGEQIASFASIPDLVAYLKRLAKDESKNEASRQDFDIDCESCIQALDEMKKKVLEWKGQGFDGVDDPDEVSRLRWALRDVESKFEIR